MDANQPSSNTQVLLRQVILAIPGFFSPVLVKEHHHHQAHQAAPVRPHVVELLKRRCLHIRRWLPGCLGKGLEEPAGRRALDGSADESAVSIFAESLSFAGLNRSGEGKYNLLCSQIFKMREGRSTPY